MTIPEKIRTTDNKVQQNKAQNNLDTQTAKISVFSSTNVSRYEFLTGKDVLQEKDLLEKAATIKRFENSPLVSELKKQTDITKFNIKDATMFLSMTKKNQQQLKKTPATTKKQPELRYESK